jgi:uncharacterized protein (TIGR02001 family)
VYCFPLTFSILLLGLLTSTCSFSEGSANLGLASNYVWRGKTQSNDKIAASGGLDYSADSGFYAGTWTSMLSGGSYELDLYGGFSKEINDITYDIGIISYQYPNDNDYFNEVYLNLVYSGFSFSMANTFDSKNNSGSEFSSSDLYLSLGYSHELTSGIEWSAILGHYDFDDDFGDDYTHYNISASKYDFTLAVDTINNLTSNNDTILSLAYSKTFKF